MISHIKAWRNGDFATFNDMNIAIMEDCSAWKIQMDYGEEYSGIVRKWCTDVIGKDIAVSLKGICENKWRLQLFRGGSEYCRYRQRP